jgi:hypothetical protein
MLSQDKDQLDAMLPGLTLVFGTNPSIAVNVTATESYLVSVGGGQWVHRHDVVRAERRLSLRGRPGLDSAALQRRGFSTA